MYQCVCMGRTIVELRGPRARYLWGMKRAHHTFTCATLLCSLAAIPLSTNMLMIMVCTFSMAARAYVLVMKSTYWMPGMRCIFLATRFTSFLPWGKDPLVFYV